MAPPADWNGVPEEEVREAFLKVKRHQHGGQRAPHKPLLLLMAIANVRQGKGPSIAFEDIEKQLGELLAEFGRPNSGNPNPSYPFWRLQNDGGLWVIHERDEVLDIAPEDSSGNARVSALRQADAHGGFAPTLYERLASDADLAHRIAGDLLEDNWPRSRHAQIVDAIGLPWEPSSRPSTRPPRSPAFREDLLRLYEHRCAMCGFDAMIGGHSVGLEAAHIQWHSQDGPDQPDNGLLLCSLHHWALDTGALGLDDDHRILVSQNVIGGQQVQELLLDLGGSAIRMPLERDAKPAPHFLEWHRSEVFRMPAREVS